MTEEEKEAYNYLSQIMFDDEATEKYVNTLLDLIDNQQKEIKKLEVCLQAEEKYAEGLNNDIKSLLNIEPNNNFISKYKIREKIKELEKECFNCRFSESFCEKLKKNNNCTIGLTITLLKELLEE